MPVCCILHYRLAASILFRYANEAKDCCGFQSLGAADSFFVGLRLGAVHLMRGRT